MNSINDLTGNTKAFAEACYDNSVEELTQALVGVADEYDCNVWHINPIEWVEAVTAALAEKKSEL
jgi:hypothetical protein